MSSRYVRNKARGWIINSATAASTALASPVDFIETINETNPKTTNVWITLEFNVFSTSKETYCGDTIEKGTITIVVCSPPGDGDDNALIAVEAAANDFYSNVDTSGALVLLEKSAPDEVVGNDGSSEYWAYIDIDYEHYY